MKIKKRCWILVLLLFVLFPSVVSAFNRDDHDKYLRKVLFGDQYKKVMEISAIEEKETLLEYASYLAIDFFGNDPKGSGAAQLSKLSEKVKGLPDNISEIKFTTSPKKIDENHRVFTHIGWENVHYSKYLLENGHWEIRRDLLLKTVNQVWIEDENKANAFAKLVYFVHILGDQIYDRDKRQELLGYSAKQKIDYEQLPEEPAIYTNIIRSIRLASKNEKHNIIDELLECLDILFYDFTHKKEFILLRRELKSYSKDASEIYDSVGGLNTNEKFFRYYTFDDLVMESLIKHVPKLIIESGLLNSVDQ